VDGASDPIIVANKFAEVFKVTCSSNSVIQNNKLFNEFLTAFDECKIFITIYKYKITTAKSMKTTVKFGCRCETRKIRANSSPEIRSVKCTAEG